MLWQQGGSRGGRTASREARRESTYLGLDRGAGGRLAQLDVLEISKWREAALNMAEQARTELCEAIGEMQMPRVIEAFRACGWEDEKTGVHRLARAGFRQALDRLGLSHDPADANAVFDEWDVKKSGVLPIHELHELLAHA